MNPTEALLAISGTLALILVSGYTLFSALGDAKRAVRNTLALFAGMVLGVGGVFALAAAGGAFA